MGQLFKYDDGPLFIFKRIRTFTDKKALADQKDSRPLSLWNNINEGVHCEFCAGFYAGILGAALIAWPTVPGDLFLLWMGLSGGQAFLQGQRS
ncbi:MAG: hypothetical protein ACYTEQ_11650 [Planctomycetota bacterium]|jgi:hypothetical protein